METFRAGDETYLERAVMRRPDYGVQPITVVFGGIGSQRRNQLVVEERARIDIDVEILQQAVVHLPEVGRGAHRSHDTLVISVRGRVVQFAVGFHHILPDPLAQAEDGGPEAQQEVAFGHIDIALDIDIRFIGGHSLGVGGGAEDDARHQRVGHYLLRGRRRLGGTLLGLEPRGQAQA